MVQSKTDMTLTNEKSITLICLLAMLAGLKDLPPVAKYYKYKHTLTNLVFP